MVDVKKQESGGVDEPRREFSPLLPLSPTPLLLFLGALSLIPYLYAFQLQDLRVHTVEFEIAFFAAFVLYAVAVVVILRDNSRTSRLTLSVLFIFAIFFRAILVLTPPTLSDDMYRYVWDGRVQANGINPYAYAPNASELQSLRDAAIWSRINRPDAITVYPAGAELAYAALWRIVPDNVRWFQIAMSSGDLIAGGLLILLLRAFNRSPNLALIYLWSPLVIFETAHGAHIDGLVLPLLVAALIAQMKGRDGWVGVFLGAAASIKIYPLILFPALWRARDDAGRWRATWVMPLALVATIALAYAPYVTQGAGLLGYLPKYLNENFNMGIAGIIFSLVAQRGGTTEQASQIANSLLALALIVIAFVLVWRPAKNSDDAIRRCVYPIGAFTLLTQNLFPWYLLWLIPLLTIFMQPGKLGLRLDAWTGWFLFSGLIALAYTFFIAWTPVAWASWVEFGPLYAILSLAFASELKNYFRSDAVKNSTRVVLHDA
jgi:alpha-1,6-mannosyltransferase